MPPKGVSQGAIVPSHEPDLVSDVEVRLARESRGPESAISPVLWAQQLSVQPLAAIEMPASSFESDTGLAAPINASPPSSGAQQSPAKPKAATEIITKLKPPINSGANRRCRRTPGMNAASAITKHASAIHLVKSLISKKTQPQSRQVGNHKRHGRAVNRTPDRRHHAGPIAPSDRARCNFPWCCPR